MIFIVIITVIKRNQYQKALKRYLKSKQQESFIFGWTGLT